MTPLQSWAIHWGTQDILGLHCIRTLFEAMNAHGVQEKYINIIKETHTEGTAQVGTEKLSGKNNIMKGIRQGD